MFGEDHLCQLIMRPGGPQNRSETLEKRKICCLCMYSDDSMDVDLVS